MVLSAMQLDWCSSQSHLIKIGSHRLEISLGGKWFSDATPSAAASQLLDCFMPLVARHKPLVMAQLGQSLDGRIATENGASHYINGLAARIHLHRLRAIVDAVVVGVGTVNLDDPQLNVRHVEGPQPNKVVIDPRARMRPSPQLLQDGQPVWQLCMADEADRLPAPLAGVRRMLVGGDADAGIAPAAILEALAQLGLRRVLIEGGGVTVSRFVAAGALDRLHVLVAPMLIGSGRAGLSLPPIETLELALRPQCRVFQCGEDSVFDLAFTGDQA